MKATLEKLEELQRSGLYNKYAIGGGIAHFYYIEAGTTYDLDVMITLNVQTSGIVSLSPLYEWAKRCSYEISDEHIIIEGVPVQFLPAYNAIVSEAIKHADRVELFGVKTYIMKPEYLMVIMLDTMRAKDRERLMKFISQAKYSGALFQTLLSKFKLVKKFEEFRAKYDE